MPLIRPTAEFNTQTRQDYIGAGILAATHLKSLLLDGHTVSCCVGGPSACGKSLFMDAVIHHLVDSLDASQTPQTDHMMLESSPDEALSFNRTAHFTIDGHTRKIGFKNLGHFESLSLRAIEAVSDKYKAHLQFFSFTGHWDTISPDSILPSVHVDVLYDIGHGHGLSRSWRMWDNVQLSKLNLA